MAWVCDECVESPEVQGWCEHHYGMRWTEVEVKGLLAYKASDSVPMWPTWHPEYSHVTSTWLVRTSGACDVRGGCCGGPKNKNMYWGGGGQHLHTGQYTLYTHPFTQNLKEVWFVRIIRIWWIHRFLVVYIPHKREFYCIYKNTKVITLGKKK